MAVLGGAFFLTLFVLSVLPQRAAIPLMVVSALLLAVTLLVRSFRRHARAPLVFGAVLAACALVQLCTATVFRPIAALHGKSVRITASLADLPRAYNEESYYYELRTRSVDGAPMRCRIGFWSAEDMQWTPSQIVSFTARVYASDAPDATGVWLRMFGVEELTVTDARPDVFARMLEARRYTIDTLLQAAPGPAGAVLAAMVTGDRTHIPADIYAHMRNCGIVHIFSVSGFHLSVFSMLLYQFLERRRVPRFAAVLPSIMLVLFLMAVTGFSASCVRAGIMLLTLLFGRLFFWQSDAINSLGVSLLIMGFISPFCAGDVGLQLSVLGALGSILASPFAGRLSRKIRVRPLFLRRALQAVLETIVLSACIHAMTLVPVALHYDTLSVISPIANAAILFAAEWAMIGAALSVLFSVISPLYFVFRALSFLAGLLARYCIAASGFLGGLPFCVVRFDRAALCLWAAGTLTVIALALLLRIGSRRRVVTVAALSLSMLLSCAIFRAWSVRDSVFVTAFDVGNHSAVLVQSRGETALIGCGGVDTAQRILRYTDDVDWLLLPRISPTECSGASELIRSVPCHEIWAPARRPAVEGAFFFGQAEVRKTGTRQVGAVRAEYIGGANAAVYLTAHGKSMLLLFSPGCDLARIPSAWQNADIVYVRGDLPPALEAEKIGLVLLSRSAAQGDPIPRAIRRSGTLVVSTADKGDLRVRIDPDGVVGFE